MSEGPPLSPVDATTGHQYLVSVVSGEYEGCPAAGTWIGQRDTRGRWLLWRAAGGQVITGLFDHEVRIERT